MPETAPLPGSSGLSTQRLLQAWENRIAGQIEAAEQTPRAYYAGGGRVEPLGANNPYRPRGIQSNANLAVGDPVQLNDGLVSATPTGSGVDTGLAAKVAQHEEAIARIRELLVDELNGEIAAAADQTYTLILEVQARSQLKSLTTEGTGTATLSVEVDGVLEVGDRLDMTLSGTNGTTFSFTVELLRLI